MPAKIHETTDYDKFDYHQHNRPVTGTGALRDSMLKYGFRDANPIDVVRNGGSKYKILQGHHRFYVARELGLPIKFVVSNDNATLRDLERPNRPWSTKDYLHYYSSQGLTDYMYVKRYHERTGITLIACISMLAGESAGSANHLDRFKDGTFRLGGLEHAETVADIVKHCEDCGVPFAKQRNFVSAISRMLWVKEFEKDEFKKKVKAHTFLMEKKPSIQDYCQLIETVYNRQRSRQNQVPLVVLADQTMFDKTRNFYPK